MSLAGDWATGTNEAAKVGACIAKFSPDYSIHLGDTYYVGKASEVNENFLGIKASGYDPVKWPCGRRGTFSLTGNHDMYSNGSGYFDVLLPAIGQKASYFSLENNYWRIIALDTGYNSTGVDFWPLRPSCKLRDEQIAWLATLNLNNDKRGIIFLSHHQPLSAFEKPFPEVALQVSNFMHRPVLWFWGHEHRMAIYNQATVSRVTLHGRCVGHGGMPVEIKKAKPGMCSFVDTRPYPNNENLKIGYNGFANLTFSGEQVGIEYRDLNDELIFSEVQTNDL